jgi:hypothetical protein
MPRRKSPEETILEYFDTAPEERVRMMLAIAAWRVKARFSEPPKKRKPRVQKVNSEDSHYAGPDAVERARARKAKTEPQVEQ